jgi:molybdopterin/thiamine biosynthesis adenylyltransferase
MFSVMKVSFEKQILGLQADRSAMKKMATSNVLIVGMKGLGVEIGKLMSSSFRTDS